MNDTERDDPRPRTPGKEKTDETPERRPDPDEEQIGILPGKVPGRPVDPSDPRFPGSQPDLA
ncbi:hypothetical protein [Arenibaculum sp.]|uniref:hypothetical protein n=1 Tax=Arenibaculum sp. TaxID=2865862 RepID=UPI002E0F67D3|nr:hypothetical protein [Arenibaculum sp.]